MAIGSLNQRKSTVSSFSYYLIIIHSYLLNFAVILLLVYNVQRLRLISTLDFVMQ